MGMKLSKVKPIHRTNEEQVKGFLHPSGAWAGDQGFSDGCLPFSFTSGLNFGEIQTGAGHGSGGLRQVYIVEM